MDIEDIQLRFWAGYGLFRTRGLILKKEGNTWFVYYPDSLKGKISEEFFFTDLTLTNANLGEDHLFGKIKVLLCGRGTNVTRISTWI